VPMRELGSPRHEILRRLLKECRERASLSQQVVADRIGRGQTFVSAVERGQHRVSVLEFLDFAEAIGFDAAAALRRVAKAAKR
jgi:transcriptional regulator with XRE-family HTH domain